MKKAITILTVAAYILTAVQLAIPTLQLAEHSQMIFSAAVMFLVSGVTIWKQKLSDCINNTALWPTIILAVVATLGGLNEFIKEVPINEVAGQWIRFGVTIITAALNGLSETIFPSQKSIIDNQKKLS